ncbi:MAG: 50S ribosomal protein L5 [Pirellulales bacterium]|nr:50S ribosomal protein L5 [Pirellulales bacterium]
MASAPRLQEKYEKEILPALAEKTGRKNRLALPRLQKIVVSMGVGSATTEKKHLDMALSALTEITGQKPSVRRATKSVAGFRLREGSPVGCMVTLRRTRMYEFLDRLIALALPRVRDFRGLKPKAFDGRGNYSLGLQEQLVFPELNPDKYPLTQGMNIALVTSTFENSEARLLLEGFGLPLQSETEETTNAS